MKHIINGKNLDSILEYCLEKHKTNNSYIFISDLEEKVFPNLNEGEIMLLIKHIENYEPKVIHIDLSYNTVIMKNDLTQSFLNDGGFSKIEDDINKENLLLNKKDNLDQELKILQKESIEYDNKFKKQNERIRDLEEQIKVISLIKSYWWVLGICIFIGVTISAILF